MLRRMTCAIEHRGPDSHGDWAGGADDPVLGHRRLAILDLSPSGRQPMISASGRYVLVFNGEIYNFRAVRDELAARGASFGGHSDTEVVLAAFEAWGIAGALPRLAGMFAMGIWDRRERALSLVRDRMGEKPLYHGRIGNSFAFASELKALRHAPGWTGEVDRAALASYLRHAYVPGPHCIYRGFAKVPPGAIVTVRERPDGDAVETRYWTLRDAVERGQREPVAASRAEAADALERLLGDVVGEQMVADVPLGAFLSGGIDSSTIVALMQARSTRPVRTFSIGFEDRFFNEAEHAKAVAAHLGTDHTELYVTPGDALAVIPSLPRLFDEPFGDSSQIPTYLVAAMARQHVTVSLSGDGADELFGGYNRYVHSGRLWSRAQRLTGPGRRALSAALGALPPRRWDALFRGAGSVSARIRRIPQPGDRIHKLARMLRVESRGELYRELFSQWGDPAEVAIHGREAPTLLDRPGEWPSVPDDATLAMYLDQLTYLPDDILQKVDRAAMAVSLETRAPFLDHRVVEFAWALPRELKISGDRGKLVVRDVLDRYVPRALVERPKMGFSVPLDAWLRGPLREWADALLAPERLAAQGYFHPAPLRRKWREQVEGRQNWGFQLWPVLMFQAWLDEERGDASADLDGSTTSLHSNSGNPGDSMSYDGHGDRRRGLGAA